MKIGGSLWSLMLLYSLATATVEAQNTFSNDGPPGFSIFESIQTRQGKTIQVSSQPLMIEGLPVHQHWEISQRFSNGKEREFRFNPEIFTRSEIFQGATHWCREPESFHLRACKKQYFHSEFGSDRIHYLDANGNRLFTENPKRFFHAQPDTLIEIQVFYPNPVVSENEAYGARLRDNQDMNSHWLDSALVTQNLRILIGEGGLRPATELFGFSEISAPYRGHPWQFGLQSKFRRGDAHFEFFNALFHLEQAAQWVREKAYPQLLTELVFDPHAMNDRDQSAFNPHHQPPSLEFGTGGVDDAEDAQVIIHEYAHALSHQAAPHSFSGRERKMIEEGNADFLAMYYSQRLNPSRNYELFSWDGHNEFWQGISLARNDRLLQTDKMELLDGREIWASCLRCIALNLVWEKAADLVLESLFYQLPEMSFEDMGQNLLFIDTLLNQGENALSLINCLSRYGVIPPDIKHSTESTALQEKIMNSEGFAYRGEDALVRLNSPALARVEIMDLSGRLIRAEEIPYGNEIRISGEGLPKGVLFVQIILKNLDGSFRGSESYRLVRVQ